MFLLKTLFLCFNITFQCCNCSWVCYCIIISVATARGFANAILSVLPLLVSLLLQYYQCCHCSWVCYCNINCKNVIFHPWVWVTHFNTNTNNLHLAQYRALLQTRTSLLIYYPLWKFSFHSNLHKKDSSQFTSRRKYKLHH